MNTKNQNNRIQAIMLGDSKVGKTCLLKRYTLFTYYDSYYKTYCK